MKLIYKCRHTERTDMHKDDLVVRIPRLCPACENKKNVEPTCTVTVKGTKTLVVKKVVRG